MGLLQLNLAPFLAAQQSLGQANAQQRALIEAKRAKRKGQTLGTVGAIAGLALSGGNPAAASAGYGLGASLAGGNTAGVVQSGASLASGIQQQETQASNSALRERAATQFQGSPGIDPRAEGVMALPGTEPVAPNAPAGFATLLKDTEFGSFALQNLGKIAAQRGGQRRIIKGADGRQHYSDTGELVLPNVQPNLAKEPKTARDNKGVLRFIAGPRQGKMVFPDVKISDALPKMNKDVNDRLRYISGPDKGTLVFPDVAKITDKEVKTLTLKEAFDRSQKLGDDFATASKDFASVQNSYSQIRELARGKASAAGDISMIFSYMKMLDPDSVVREGEQATAGNARGVPDAFRSFYNRVVTGERLTPRQRKDFLNQANRVYSSRVRLQKIRSSNFRKIARRAKLNPQDILQRVAIDRGLSAAQRRTPKAAPEINRLDEIIGADTSKMNSAQLKKHNDELRKLLKGNN